MKTLCALLLAASAAHAEPPGRIGVKDTGGCTPKQREAVNTAKPEAKRRILAAQALVSRMTGGEIAAADKVKGYYKLLDMSWDPKAPASLERNLGTMAQTVESADYQCSGKEDKNCGARAGYVNRADGAVIVHLCPLNFFDSPSSQANTLVHESAHLLDPNIGDRNDAGAQSYCGLFDCEDRCSDGPTVEGKPRPYFIADNWAHFIYCAAGEKPQLDVITATKK
jgi:hypothetical protein